MRKIKIRLTDYLQRNTNNTLLHSKVVQSHNRSHEGCLDPSALVQVTEWLSEHELRPWSRAAMHLPASRGSPLASKMLLE